MFDPVYKFLRCCWKAITHLITHDGVEHAGYMAFLFMLSFFPFLILIISLTGFVGKLNLGADFVNFILLNLPAHVVSGLKPRVDEILSGPPQSLLTVAILGALWTASSSVEALRTILNRIYKVKSPPAYIWRRLLSIGQFMILMLVLMMVMSFLVFFPVFMENILLPFLAKLKVSIDFYSFIPMYLRYVAVSGILFFAISWLYYILPNVKLRFIDVLPGALLVVIGWVISGYLLSEYIKNFQQVNLIYGSLGGVIIALIFFYILSMILIFGSEFNYFWKIRNKPSKKS